MDALMAGALPFHATNHFVRLVQTLHLQHSIWQFLAPMQQSGASMPRSTLVLRCTRDKVNLDPTCAAVCGIYWSSQS